MAIRKGNVTYNSELKPFDVRNRVGRFNFRIYFPQWQYQKLVSSPVYVRYDSLKPAAYWSYLLSMLEYEIE